MRNARSPGAPVNTWPVMPSASAPRHVGLAVVDEDGLGGADPQVVQDVPVDVRVRLEQAEFAADVARREEVAERAVPEVAAVVRAGVGQQRQPGPAGPQVGEHVDGGRVDRQPAAEVRRPQLVHPRLVPARADVGGDRPPVRGDARACPGRARRGARSRRARTARSPSPLTPARPLDHRPVGGRLRQRDDLAVVEDHGPAGQREGRTGHRGSPAAIDASSAMRSAANLPSAPTGCRTTWSAPASRCSRSRSRRRRDRAGRPRT